MPKKDFKFYEEVEELLTKLSEEELCSVSIIMGDPECIEDMEALIIRNYVSKNSYEDTSIYLSDIPTDRELPCEQLRETTYVEHAYAEAVIKAFSLNFIFKSCNCNYDLYAEKLEKKLAEM